jgi:hypothetical protein
MLSIPKRPPPPRNTVLRMLSRLTVALKVAYCSGFPSRALAERSQLRVDGPLINKPYQKTAGTETVIAMRATPTANEEHAA